MNTTKKTFPFIGVFAAFMVALASASCMKEAPELPTSSVPFDSIVFGVDDSFRAEVQTKATEVTSLSSFYVTAVTGSAGSESSVWNSVQFSQVPGSSPATYAGNKYWPASNPSYKFYGSNVALNFAAGGTYVNASNATDVVCAYLSSPTYNTKNTLTFEHIFARLCRVDIVAASGYTLSDISLRITPKTGGTYNLRTKEWSSVATGSATTIASSTGANNNDIFCVPGIYSITASWVARDASGASVTHTNEVCNVPLTGGKTNNISCVLGGDITFGVDLQDYADYDYRDNLDYLTFYCDEAGTIGWKNYNGSSKTIQYSKDFGATWTSLRSTTIGSGATIAVNAGDIVWFKGSNTEYADGYCYNQFTLSNKAHVYGNVNSLTGNNSSVSEYCFKQLFYNCSNLYTYEHKKIILPATTLAQYCYSNMFYGCTSLTTAPELPATTLASRCYYSMFQGCTSLTAAPELPATTLAERCYSYMFYGCTSLTTAPELPATTLASDCYNSMFRGCSSLTTAPELPATTLANNCYNIMFWDCASLTSAPVLPATMLTYGCYSYMFYGCTSLTTAPELPATTLANQCYESMFQGCTSLTTAPELPATTLAFQCYSTMFQGCTSLNYIKALFTTTPSSSYTYSWVRGVAPTGTFVKSVDATWDVTGDNGVPTGWLVQKGTYDAKDNLAYLTFYCDEAGTIGWKCSDSSIARTIQYSKDFGATWTNLTSTTDGATVSVAAGDIVWFKGSNTEYATSSYYNQFVFSNKVHVYGNVNSLTGNNTSVSAYCFKQLFYNCSNLYTYEHKKIILPATTLASRCYYDMFSGCTSLTTAPELPATTLADYCYNSMFRGCSSLTIAPELPATTLASNCYGAMFSGCASLTTAPELPATTLADYCYSAMFQNCTFLTSAPELPVTTLAISCYSAMFQNCTSLTTAPELPATTLANFCYFSMFAGCTSLNYIKALFTTDPSSGSYTLIWVSGVAPTGTFVKNVGATWNVTGNNGVPTGWTVKVETPGPGQWMDNPSNYLRFKFVTDGQVRWQNKKGDIQYSKNGGAWTAFNGATVSMSAGDEIWFKGDLTGGVGASSEANSSKFASSGKFYVSGNVQSLCSFNNTLQNYHFANLFFKNAGLNIDISTPLSLPATTLADYCYQGMFSGCSSLTTAPELPATTLAQECYSSMFYGCTLLTTAPELPATTLASRCYYNMFYGCTSLTTAASELPATTLADYCYQGMFYGCTLLTTAPELPATTLAGSCYSSMFQNCSSLTTAPELPATTLEYSCYASMFSGCSSLTTAPELPATTLLNNCYSSMFQGCTSLTTASELPATTLVYSCYQNMFNGCTSLTTAPELPATTLAEECYSSMFYGCTLLTTAPELPATTLASRCYYNMFYGCTSLTTAASELPATTLAENCYSFMFQGCTSLTTAPELPAVTLAYGCYSSMFSGCTSLTTAPELPATTLAGSCYQSMFQGCTSLTTAPELPATTLANSCYGAMFYDCSSLNYIKALFRTTPSWNYTSSWVGGVASTGTFVKSAAATWNVTGENGVPTGWTVVTE